MNLPAMSLDRPVPRGDAEVRVALDRALDRARQVASYADVLYERIYKSEANLLRLGQVIVKPASLKGAAQVRLVGAEGRHVGVRAGEVTPEALLPGAVDCAAAALAAEPAAPEFGLAPIPNPSRVRYGLVIDEDPREVDPTGAFLDMVEGVKRIAAERSSESVRVVPELWSWTQVEEKWVADTDGVFKTQVMPVSFLQVIFRAVRGEEEAKDARALLVRPLAWATTRGGVVDRRDLAARGVRARRAAPRRASAHV